MEGIEKDLLGICIPTYNRSRYLSECLKSVIDEFYPYGFPIYISDNCSTDNTTSVVSSFEKDYDNIKYVRNNSNLGLYRNILNVMQMAETRYIWFMGDDDAIKKGSVERLVEIVNTSPDFLVLNSALYDKELAAQKYPKAIDCLADKKYLGKDVQNLLIDLKKWSYNGYMSAMVIKKEFLAHLIPKYKEANFLLYGTIWLPLALFYEAIHNRTGLFVCEPMVLNRDNPRPSEKGYWEYFYLDRIRALEYLERMGYYRKIVRKVVKSSILDIVYSSIMARSENKEPSLLDDYLKKTDLMSLSDKIVIQMVNLFPSSLIKLMKDAILKVKESRVYPSS
jgi:glycosyltransferase involved in cell wall biosynthesis